MPAGAPPKRRFQPITHPAGLALFVNVTARMCAGSTPRVCTSLGDPECQDSRLARAGSCEHQQRSFVVLDRLALRRIERLNERMRLSGVGRQDHCGKIMSNVAPRSTGTSIEPAAVVVFDDAARKGQWPMPQPCAFVEKPARNTSLRKLTGNAWPVVRDP